MNKLSLVGILQLPKKYKENFDVSSEGSEETINFMFPILVLYCRCLDHLYRPHESLDFAIRFWLSSLSYLSVLETGNL